MHNGFRLPFTLMPRPKEPWPLSPFHWGAGGAGGSVFRIGGPAAKPPRGGAPVQGTWWLRFTLVDVLAPRETQSHGGFEIAPGRSPLLRRSPYPFALGATTSSLIRSGFSQYRA